MQDEKIKEIVNKLVSDYQPEKIILFGSYVAGRIHEWSDADLVIIKETGKRFYDRIGEVSLLVEHKLPLDFLVYTPSEFSRMVKQSDFIRDEVYKKGKVLYER